MCTTGGGPNVRQTYLNIILERCFGGTPRLRPLISISCGTSESAIQQSASVNKNVLVEERRRHIEQPLHSLNDRAVPDGETDSLENSNGIVVKMTLGSWTWKGGGRADTGPEIQCRRAFVNVRARSLPDTSDKRPQKALSQSALTSRWRRSGTSPMIISEM